MNPIKRDSGFNPVRKLITAVLKLAHENKGISPETAKELKSLAYKSQACISRKQEKRG